MSALSGNIYRTLVLLVVLVAGLAPGSAAQPALCRAFSETGKSVCGRFLSYWQENGGLAQQGFPISEEIRERSETDGKDYTMQYFERAVYEFHPENTAPYDVLLTLLGTTEYGKRYGVAGAPNQRASTQNSMRFPQTGKTLGGVFHAYWERNGGLPQQGYPISNEFEEWSVLDGKTYRVQYFERAVFEHHPENAGTPYEVLLSHLGAQRYEDRYVARPPAPTSTRPPATISTVALAYLTEALNYIQENSIMRDRIDWPKIRSMALEFSRDAQTTADTYPAIRYVIDSLGDGHSAFFAPSEVSARTVTETMGLWVWYADRTVTDVGASSLAAQVGVRVGDLIETINGRSPELMSASDFFRELYGGSRVDLMLRRGEGEDAQLHTVSIPHQAVNPLYLPHGRRMDGNIGYILLPANSRSPIRDQYATIVQQIIRDIDQGPGHQAPIRGWIVDLQWDAGGSLTPMVMGVGPVLGEGELGKFIDAYGRTITWAYRTGEFLHDNEVIAQVDRPYQLRQPMPPVAVLTGQSTASAGEATLISFRGRPQTRSFGEYTAGIPTGREGMTMSDGAAIALTTAQEMDRTGRLYGVNERIAPDEYVRAEYRLIGALDDPVMRAGYDWLMAEAQRK
jgi:carboxyl-terminal processing protease